MFLRLFLISQLYAPPELQEDPAAFQGMIRRFGITLNSSEFIILDRAKIGNSFVTIAKYSLDYQYGDAEGSKQVCVEGTVSSQVEEPGNIHIRILSSFNPLRTYFRPALSSISPVGS